MLASPSKIGILIDSGTRYFSPRMKLLQNSLAGKNLTTLYRDRADQRDHWTAALGDRLGKVGLWVLPMTVETLLFTNPEFVEATQQSLVMFRPEFPLLLRPDEAAPRGTARGRDLDYVDMRFKERATLTDRKTPMPPVIQKVLDVYATYFLGHVPPRPEQPGEGRALLREDPRMLPEPTRGSRISTCSAGAPRPTSRG